MNIVARSFTPVQFAAYVKELNLPACGWQGQFCVLHNTSVPSLAQRPNGFSHDNMLALADYYSGLNWSHGPHLFIDDHFIWAFSPLTAPGVHSPSWNKISYGIEQLGEYDTEPYGEGVRGSAVRANAVAAMAVICHSVGIDSGTMHLHKEDVATTHKNCPGKNCSSTKQDIIQRVHHYIELNLAGK